MDRRLSSLVRLVEMWQKIWILKKSTRVFHFCSVLLWSLAKFSCWCFKGQLFNHLYQIVVIYFLKCFNGMLLLFWAKMLHWTNIGLFILIGLSASIILVNSFRHFSLTLPQSLNPVWPAGRPIIINLLEQPNDFQPTQPHFKFWSRVQSLRYSYFIDCKHQISLDDMLKADGILYIWYVKIFNMVWNDFWKLFDS